MSKKDKELVDLVTYGVRQLIAIKDEAVALREAQRAYMEVRSDSDVDSSVKEELGQRVAAQAARLDAALVLFEC